MSQELKLDPLYTILEKHLYDFNDDEESQQQFIDNIANDYIQYLVSRQVAVPAKWRGLIMEELRNQIRSMLVKKMYGCLSIKEFVTNQKDVSAKRKTVRKKFAKLF